MKRQARCWLRYYFRLGGKAAVIVLTFCVQEIRQRFSLLTVRTQIDTARRLIRLARDDILSGNPTGGKLAKSFPQLQDRGLRKNISKIVKVCN